MKTAIALCMALGMVAMVGMLIGMDQRISYCEARIRFLESSHLAGNRFATGGMTVNFPDGSQWTPLLVPVTGGTK